MLKISLQLQEASSVYARSHLQIVSKSTEMLVTRGGSPLERVRSAAPNTMFHLPQGKLLHSRRGETTNANHSVFSKDCPKLKRIEALVISKTEY